MTKRDPHAAQRRAVRQRLLRLEQQAKNRVEEAALEESLATTVAMGEARGSEFKREPQRRGEARKPIRRLTGLAWLLGKDRITSDQYQAGLRYGAAFQKAKGDDSIRSILDRDPSSGGGCHIAHMLARGEERVYAAEKLEMYRRQLARQSALISACNLICGEEMTPREAAMNGRGADAIEAVLIVALDILAQHVAPPKAKTSHPAQDVEMAA